MYPPVNVRPSAPVGIHPRTRWTLMISRTDVVTKAGTVGPSTPDLVANRLGFLSLLLLSAWCGLVAGLLEVGTIVLRKQLFDPDHLYKMSRHFVWLIPLSNLCVFLTLGLFGCGVILVWPRRGRWLFMRVPCARLPSYPSILVAFPRIYGLAWLVVALGLAARLVPRIERNTSTFPTIRRGQFPGGRRDRGEPGGITLGRRPDQASARECAARCRRRGRRMSS